MTESDALEPLLSAKLHRPVLPEDWVHRQALVKRLAEGEKRSLTLICAPAGYGKTSLAIDWLERSSSTSCWLSLDESDGDFRTFLRYLINTLQLQTPGICDELLNRIKAENIPSVSSLSTAFSNEIEHIEGRVILALDDYYLIQDPEIHDFLNNLLEYPLRTLHLALITRRNPPLSLASLRANHQINEIRMNDLRFSESESAAFLGKSCKKTLNISAARQIHNGTEGWAVGLRLAALALQHQADLSGLNQFDGDVFEVQQYLMSEVLNARSAQERDWMCKTAILGQFTAELCEHLCGTAAGTSPAAVKGDEFIRMLHNGGLFCVALDHRGQWHRYHHQFQILLREQLNTHYASAEIQALHLTAGKWLEEHGQIEHALRHYSLCGDKTQARDCILNNRQEAFRKEESYRVQYWLRIIGDVGTQDPELLLVRAWIAQKNTRYAELKEILPQLERALERDHNYLEKKLRQLRGECETMRCVLAFWSADARAAIAHADKSLELLPTGDPAKGFSILLKLSSLQMLGESNQATAFAKSLLAHKQYREGTIHGRLLQGLCYNSIFDGDTPSLLRNCAALEKYGDLHQLPESLEHARYFRGIASYQLNNLPEAAINLESIVTSKSLLNYHIHTAAVCAMCYVHQAMGEDTKALELASSLVENALNSGATGAIDTAQACLADMALMQGRLAEASRWANSFDCTAPSPPVRSIMPELIYLKIRIAEDTPAARQEVETLLGSLQAFLERVHSTRFLVELLALRALALVKQSRRDEAQRAMEEAVDMAREGGYIRLFVDLGPELAPLLSQLTLDEQGLEHVGRILSAYPGSAGQPSSHRAAALPLQSAAITDAAASLLSKREQEILLLLAQRMNNKEIGEKLFISPATVKRHAHNIYEKLGVHSRREAVAKATGLGLIPAS